MVSTNQDYVNGYIPYLEKQRYAHNYTSRRLTTFNTGELVPIYYNETIEPGETFRMNISGLIRMTTPIFPTMDNIRYDIFAFATPIDKLFNKYREYMGENEDSWAQETVYDLPKLKFEKDTVPLHTVANHLAIPYKIAEGEELSRISINNYCFIYNYWFRDENYIDSIKFDKSEATLAFDETKPELGGKLVNVCRLHDRFSNLTPEPLKVAAGDIPTMPIGTEAPVIGTGIALGMNSNNQLGGLSLDGDTLHVYSSAYGQSVTGNRGNTVVSTTQPMGVVTDPTKSGLMTKLNEVTGVDLGTFRMFLGINHLLENFMRFGTRLGEIYKGSWGVVTPELYLGVPEFIGGDSIPMQMEQITQTSSAAEEPSPLGTAGGMSKTFFDNISFTKSFTMHTAIMVLVCARATHTYSQGIPRQLMATRKYDRHWPEFDGLSYQPVYEKEIFAGTTLEEGNKVLGYEPYCEWYRREPYTATGLFGTDAPENIATYFYGDHYTAPVTIDKTWLEETPEYVDRTLIAQSSITDQFIGDFGFEITRINTVKPVGTPGMSYV